MTAPVKVTITAQDPGDYYAYRIDNDVDDSGRIGYDFDFAKTRRGARRVARRMAKRIYRECNDPKRPKPGDVETVEYP